MSSKTNYISFYISAGNLDGQLDSTIVILAFPTIAEKLRTGISAAIGLSSLLDVDRPGVTDFLV